MSLIPTVFDQAYRSFDAGVSNNTPPFTTAPPDASGGGGSFLPGLLDTLLNGVNAVVQTETSKYIGDRLGGGLASVDEYGNVVYRGSPGSQAPAQIAPAYAAKSFFSSTPGIITIVAVVGILAFAVLKD